MFTIEYKKKTLILGEEERDKPNHEREEKFQESRPVNSYQAGRFVPSSDLSYSG